LVAQKRGEIEENWVELTHKLTSFSQKSGREDLRINRVDI
jgi:hypothetical protein